MFSEPPRLGLVALSSAAWFFDHIEISQATGGFLARFMPSWIRKPDRYIPTPKKFVDAAQTVQALAEKLKRIAGLRGTVDISGDLGEMYHKWYVETGERFAQQPNQEIIKPFWKRHRAHALKLATIYELSSSASLKVTPESMNKAFAKCREFEQTIYELAGTKLSKAGVQSESFERWMRDGAVEGCTRDAVFNRLSELGITEYREADDYIQMFTNRGLGVYFKRHTGGRGRPAYILVHRDFVSQYQTKYPGDKHVTLGRPVLES